MADINGTAIITVDGSELQSIPGTVKFNPGLTVGKARSGPRGFVGSSSIPSLSTLACDLLPLSGFDIGSLAKNKIVTARVTDVNTSDEWVVPEMVMTESPSFEDGEDAKWSVSFEGAKAEKV